ncbi:unnamed protein product [Calicophoron daubneyi]|uniref:Uncharacterized protein n=1 Tax=Calicophoron daubneyi TaxID=300641 RepID=A0AAV2TW01_CALDB
MTTIAGDADRCKTIPARRPPLRSSFRSGVNFISSIRRRPREEGTKLLTLHDVNCGCVSPRGREIRTVTPQTLMTLLELKDCDFPYIDDCWVTDPTLGDCSSSYLEQNTATNPKVDIEDSLSVKHQKICGCIPCTSNRSSC